MSPARVLIDRETLGQEVRRLAVEVSAAYPDGVVLVAVLKGSVLFLADLVRHLTILPVVDFLAISSYAEGTGRVRIVKDIDTDVSGRHVLLIEDIVDTGLTATYLVGEMTRRGAASVAICTLLDRSGRRIVPTPVRFVGFPIADDYVVGYGLDYRERHRNLGQILVADPETLGR